MDDTRISTSSRGELPAGRTHWDWPTGSCRDFRRPPASSTYRAAERTSPWVRVHLEAVERRTFCLRFTCALGALRRAGGLIQGKVKVGRKTGTSRSPSIIIIISLSIHREPETVYYTVSRPYSLVRGVARVRSP